MPDQQSTVETTAERASTKSGSNAESLVVFGLGSMTFSINANVVNEIIHPLPVTQLPNCPDSIEGVAVLRGELIAVLNIRSIMDIAESEATQRCKWIVLSAVAGSTKFAFPVNKLIEITTNEDSPKGEDGKRPRLSRTKTDPPLLDINSIISKFESALL